MLTEKNKKFALNYVATHNATKSYQKAYETDNIELAASGGSRLVHLPEVQQEIIRLSDALGMDNEYLLRRIKFIVDADVAKKVTGADVLKGTEMVLNMKNIKTRQESKSVTTETESLEFEGKSVEELEGMLRELKESQNRLEALEGAQGAESLADSEQVARGATNTQETIGQAEADIMPDISDQDQDASGQRAKYTIKRTTTSFS